MNSTKFKLNLMSFIYNIFLWYSLGILLFVLWQAYFGGVLLCDSISDVIVEPEDINKIEVNHSEENPLPLDVHNSGIFLKSKNAIRRKLYWFFVAKSSDNYKNYEDFQKSWNPRMSLSSELKAAFSKMKKDPLADFNETREKARRDLAKVMKQDEVFTKMRMEVDRAKAIRYQERMNSLYYNFVKNKNQNNNKK